jgi:pyridoxamine 5'-phosphate oxidase
MNNDDLTKHVPGTHLLCAAMDADPMRQFAAWLDDAERAGVELANAMALATANRAGQPSARMVLLRGIDQRGFVFFTNYGSRKARELLENQAAALVFCWLALSRQVRVEGTVTPVEEGESDRYFAGRPRGHQLEAHASPQSQVIPDREYLDRKFREAETAYHGQEVPRPAHWGGFRLVPSMLEFWQEGQHRLHDRLRYRRDSAGAWVLERLAP